MPVPKRKTARKTVRARANPGGGGTVLYLKVGAVAVAILLAVLWVGRMQQVAYKERLHRELSESSALGDWYREQVGLVGGGSGPAAVWHGRIAGLTVGNPAVAGAQRPLRAVRISDAVLLAGVQSPGDSPGDVFINVTDYPLTYGTPVAGQRWVFSVSHTHDGRNIVYSAAPSRD